MSENDNNDRRNQYRLFWEKACEKFSQSLISSARRLANGKIYDAEDLVQETICHTLICSKNPEEIRNPLGYLLGIMHNAWIDKWKKEHTANTDSLDSTKALQIQQLAIESNVLRILENKELKDEMSNKQGPLNPREKLLLKYHLEGLNCKEIAAKLNEDVRLTRSDLNAVKAKVRARLAKAKAKTTAPGLP